MSEEETALVSLYGRNIKPFNRVREVPWEEHRHEGIDALYDARSAPLIQRHAYMLPKEVQGDYEKLLNLLKTNSFRTPYEVQVSTDPFQSRFRNALEDLFIQGARAVFDLPSGLIQLTLPNDEGYDENYVFDIYVLFARGDLALMVQAIYVMTRTVSWGGLA